MDGFHKDMKLKEELREISFESRGALGLGLSHGSVYVNGRVHQVIKNPSLKQNMLPFHSVGSFLTAKNALRFSAAFG